MSGVVPNDIPFFEMFRRASRSQIKKKISYFQKLLVIRKMLLEVFRG
jgi:hypothetical protein